MALDTGIHAGMTTFWGQLNLCITMRAPAWESSLGSSSFLSREAGASPPGFPSWSLGTSETGVNRMSTNIQCSQ
jgi:hypothetical protein